MDNLQIRVCDGEALLSLGERVVRLKSLSDGIVRCTVSPGGRFSEASPLDIQPLEESGPVWTVTEDAAHIDLSNGSLEVWIDRETPLLTWRAPSGEILLAEGGWEMAETPVIKYSTGGEPPVIRREKTVDGERNFVENLRPYQDRTAYRAKHHLRFSAGEHIHGLGQGEEGIFDYRGKTQYLYQHNMRIPVPFFQSTAGYGILYDCGGLMTWNDDERGSYVFLDTVDQLDYYFLHGESADGIIRLFRQLTGRAALLPKWAFGYVQSKERYCTQEEMVAVAAEYRHRDLPLDCLVQDWNTWAPGQWGDKHVDRERFPDLAAMNDALHNMNVHTMVSVWPNMNPGCPNHREFLDHDLLLGDVSTYDAFREEGRRMYWKQANEELFSGGFDSWWCDSTEPFSGPDWGGPILREPWERFALVGGEHKKYLDPALCNRYAVEHAKGMYEGQRSEAPGRRVLNLTRSGSAGIQRYGAVLWSGDICARWDVLRAQVAEGLNLCLSGMPWWTLDIGAFFTVRDNWQGRGCGKQDDPQPLWFWRGDFEDGVADPGYRELYLRWFQMGAFLPMFRSHGTDTPREIWQFGSPGDTVYDSLEHALRLRYRLMPYLYSVAAAVTLDHGTMLRALLFDFPGDARAAACGDQFLVGGSLLVCPVLEPMSFGPGGKPLAREMVRSCYLPEGTGWYDWHTGDRYTGGQTVEMAAPLDHIPLFVREGSILVMEAGLRYASEVPVTPLEIHIYPGRDGEFRLYEDEGDGYGYEDGAYNRISLKWNDGDRVLDIGGCRHSFPASMRGRQVVVLVHGTDGCGRGMATYQGEPLRIQL